MKYFFLLYCILFITPYSQAQTLISNRDKIEIARKKLAPAIENFSMCVANTNLDHCIAELIKNAENEYEKYLVAGILFNIDSSKSFRIHKEAYDTNPNNLDFTLEYAIELHRKRDFNEAIILYENYLASVTTPENYYRINIWLSECYINTGNIDQCILNWKKCNYTRHHTSIDFALYSIHGPTNLLRQRDSLRKEIIKGNHVLFYGLIYNDVNWPLDWWNTRVNESFLAEDLLLLQNSVSKTSSIYKTIHAYIEIKKID